MIVGLLTVLFLLPVGYIVWLAVDIGPSAVAELLFRERVLRLLGSTLALVAVAVPAAVVLGVAAAWLVERTTLPGRKVWGVLFAAPLAVPAFVISYAWLGIDPSIGGLSGGVLISICAYFPLVYLPAAATLRWIDPAEEEVARSLGVHGWGIVFRVLVPQLRLAVVGGGLLVALHLLAEYGAFSMIRFDTFTTAIVDQYQSSFASASGGVLAGVLVLVCLALLMAEAGARGRARYARLGAGAARRTPPVRLGRWTPVALLGSLAVVVISLGVPVFVVGRWLVVGGTEVWANPDLPEAFAQSVGYGFYGGLGCVLLALPVAWLTIRYPGPTARLVESGNYIASSVPGIVVALALTTVSIHVLPQIYQTVVLVLAAYVLLFLPRAVVTLRAGLAQAPERLEEAARSLGCPPWRAVLTVTIRRMMPSMVVAFALVFLAVLNELTATLLLSPAGTSTLATRFWALGLDLDYAAAAPFAMIMIVMSAPMTYLLLRQTAAGGR
ncbi:ABC transporter permease [Dietzia aurantiaca]|uniref:ABC transporter permease n=1 Tax=Dietzia aurantiaca TaxID=983873 RepID=UPI0035577253